MCEKNGSELVSGALAGILLGNGLASPTDNNIVLNASKCDLTYVTFKDHMLKILSPNHVTYSTYTASYTNMGNKEVKGLVFNPGIDLVNDVTVPKLISRMDELGLMMMWMDIGNLIIDRRDNKSISRSGMLDLCAYNVYECRLIHDMFKSKFGIDCNLSVHSNVKLDITHHYIRFNATALRRLIDLVRPYITAVPDYVNDVIQRKFNMEYAYGDRSDDYDLANKYNIGHNQSDLYMFKNTEEDV